MILDPERFSLPAARRHATPVAWLVFYLWMLTTIVVAAWWLFQHPDVALVLMIYVTAPLALLWTVVRVVRAAWKG